MCLVATLAANSVEGLADKQCEMISGVYTRPLRCTCRLVLAVVLAGVCAILAPATSRAAMTTFGSPLSVPATLNTAEHLNYKGTNTAVPPSAETPSGLYHTYHFGADTALWNVSLASGTPSAPATGQAVKVSLEGCAEPVAGGPAPLTQIHFQDVTPLPGGGARVNLTSQAFDIPVCGRNGASGSTVTTYEPINLCVSQGDYVDMNDEGGFVEHLYQNGVGYKVLGSVQGSASVSFIRGGGTNDGATMAASDTTAMDGFGSNRNQEVMLQTTLGTGPDATHICAGGTAGRPAPLAALKVRPQTDGVNEAQMISIAMYCRPVSGCRGVASLGRVGKTASYGHASFSLPGNKTSHVLMHVSSGLMAMIRRSHGVSVIASAVMGTTTASQTIIVKIL
jgi:hypothetical protein